MKNIFVVLAMAAAMTCGAADPNPYADYGSAMKSVKDAPMAAEWQAANAEKIEEATDEDVLADIVACPCRARALLDKLQGAYRTCPMAMVQIAAVTQWVMTPEPAWYCFWKPSPKEGREVWVAALTVKMMATDDEYVRTFCRQQLDLCK